jgi:fibronectin type 3 domain-containing protein
VTFVDNGNGTATLGGTPSTGTAGTYAITLKAHNGVGTDASQNFTLTVAGSASPPVAPTGLMATPGNAQVALSWSAVIGATSYNVKRATVSGGPYTTVASPTATSYPDSGLTNGTTYYYVVTAVNAVGESGNSNQVSGTPQLSNPPPPSIAFVQVAAATPQSPTSTVAVTYPSSQTAGNLNVVVVGWNDTTATVQSVSDSAGNAYTRAVGPTAGTNITQSIYFARNIKVGSNTVAVTFNQAVSVPDVRVLEYSGIDPVNTLDVVSGSSGNSSSANSGSAMTTVPNELIVGANTVFTGNQAPGSSFTTRIITTPDSDLAEDRIVAATGTYSATATLTSSGPWVMQMATFKAAGSSGAPTAPVGLTATPGNTQVVLSWSASSGATSYNVKRSTVSGGPYGAVGSSTSTSYTDTTVSNGTIYYYVVTAVSALGESGNSNQASATPGPPTVPTGLTATPGNTQVALSWTGSAGATSYNVKRATVSGGPYTTVASRTVTNYTDTGLTNGTTYYYVVSALNAAGESGNSSQASATPTGLPAAPTGLTANASGPRKIKLQWTQSTSSGVTSNRVYQTVGGSTTLIATINATTTYTNSGLSSRTNYCYYVTAVTNSGESAPSTQACATAK